MFPGLPVETLPTEVSTISTRPIVKMLELDPFDRTIDRFSKAVAPYSYLLLQSLCIGVFFAFQIYVLYSSPDTVQSYDLQRGNLSSFHSFSTVTVIISWLVSIKSVSQSVGFSCSLIGFTMCLPATSDKWLIMKKKGLQRVFSDPTELHASLENITTTGTAYYPSVTKRILTSFSSRSEKVTLVLKDSPRDLTADLSSIRLWGTCSIWYRP